MCRCASHSENDLEQVVTQLGTGEAIITVMNERGAPDAGCLDLASGAAGVDVAERGQPDRGGSERIESITPSASMADALTRSAAEVIPIG